MSKRKKRRTSGEGIHPQKPPKNPRLGDCDGTCQSFKLNPSCHTEESEARSGLGPCAEQSGKKTGQVASSSLDKEAGAPSRLLMHLTKESIPLSSSQNSFGRFVPQFAKPRKALTRLAATSEEDLRTGAFSLETPPESSAQQAGSQLREESPELTVWKASEPGDQTQADGTCSEHSIQNPETPVSSRRDSQPEVSSDVSPEWGMASLASERASQSYLLEQGTNLPDSGSLERGGIPADHDPKGRLLSSGAEEKEPDQGAPQKKDARGGARTNQEKEDSVLGQAIQGSEPGSAAQALPDPIQTLSRAGQEAEGSCSDPRCSSLRIIVITDAITDQRVVEEAGPGGEANNGVPATPSTKAPDVDCRGAPLRGMPLTRETTGGRGEAEQEAEPCCDVLGGPAGSLALVQEIQEPILGAGDSSPIASEMGPVVDQTQMPGLDQEGLRGVCVLPLLSQPLGEKATELVSQSHEPLGSFSLSLGASVPLLHREAVDGPPWDGIAHQGSLDAPVGPAGQPQHPPDSSDQDMLRGSTDVELDFLPDSQIQEALEAPNFEAPCEQLFPAGSGVDPCWPGTSLGTDGGPLTKVQSSTHNRIKPCEACRMEDATDTVHGLIVELSNLNRLIMNAHRDLEAVKRLYYRKAKPAGKAPLPYTSKGAGTLLQVEQAWRDL
ncbi:break repair meiotic recombinase recruitment factor 1 [Saccopteryx leptura]|uniref:break repair meiotic recombinase recruitment factor 1 n=1 Tax=Saccopteryx leptura TaxID=249018 RepID=UPI00339C9E35